MAQPSAICERQNSAEPAVNTAEQGATAETMLIDTQLTEMFHMQLRGLRATSLVERRAVLPAVYRRRTLWRTTGRRHHCNAFSESARGCCKAAAGPSSGNRAQGFRRASPLQLTRRSGLVPTAETQQQCDRSGAPPRAGPPALPPLPPLQPPSAASLHSLRFTETPTADCPPPGHGPRL